MLEYTQCREVGYSFAVRGDSQLGSRDPFPDLAAVSAPTTTMLQY